MIDSMHVLDVLRERGYVPQDIPGRSPETWFDLDVDGTATVRAILTPEDGCQIHLFSARSGLEWSVRFSGAPGAVFLATLDAAEAAAYAMTCQCGAHERSPRHAPDGNFNGGHDYRPRGRRHSPGWAGTGYGGR